MNNMRRWIVGLAIASLLAIGVVTLAANGPGNSTASCPQQRASVTSNHLGRDADGDGTTNTQDADWTRPLDGSGYGQGPGLTGDAARNRLLDGSGSGAGNGHAPGSWCLGNRGGSGLGSRSGRGG